MRTTSNYFFAGATAALIAVTTILSGCATGPVHFQRKLSASEPFEQPRVLTGHQYYAFGHPQKPLALVAIQNDYRLASPKWKPIDVDPQMIGTFVSRMLNQPGAEYNMFPNGAYILNDNGETIGYWYSVWALPVLRFTAEKEFTISDPVTRFPLYNNESKLDGDPIFDR
jgi:hypothetical protein